MKHLTSISSGIQSVAKLYAPSFQAICWIMSLLLIFSSPVFGAEAYSGLLIYMEPPIGSMKTPEALPYGRFERKGAAVSDLVLLNGKTREILNGGILGVLQMPNGTSATSEIVEQNAGTIMRKYPTVRPMVEDFLVHYRQAVAEAQKAHTPTRVGSVRATSNAQLVVAGTTYTSVTLDSVEGGAAKIMHSDGVVSLPLATLTKDQIALLNTTSSAVHIDPDWKTKVNAGGGPEPSFKHESPASPKSPAGTYPNAMASDGQRIDPAQIERGMVLSSITLSGQVAKRHNEATYKNAIISGARAGAFEFVVTDQTGFQKFPVLVLHGEATARNPDAAQAVAANIDAGRQFPAPFAALLARASDSGKLKGDVDTFWKRTSTGVTSTQMDILLKKFLRSVEVYSEQFLPVALYVYGKVGKNLYEVGPALQPQPGDHFLLRSDITAFASEGKALVSFEIVGKQTVALADGFGKEMLVAEEREYSRDAYQQASREYREAREVLLSAIKGARLSREELEAMMLSVCDVASNGKPIETTPSIGRRATASISVIDYIAIKWVLLGSGEDN